MPNARPETMDLFLAKLEEMGHTILPMIKLGIRFTATPVPRGSVDQNSTVSGIPNRFASTDVTAQLMAHGMSIIEETVFENRFSISQSSIKWALGHIVNRQVKQLFMARTAHRYDVIASDIRASLALVLAGLVAEGIT